MSWITCVGSPDLCLYSRASFLTSARPAQSSPSSLGAGPWYVCSLWVSWWAWEDILFLCKLFLICLKLRKGRNFTICERYAELIRLLSLSVLVSMTGLFIPSQIIFNLPGTEEEEEYCNLWALCINDMSALSECPGEHDSAFYSFKNYEIFLIFLKLRKGRNIAICERYA